MSKKNVHHLSWRKSRKKIARGTNRVSLATRRVHKPTVSERRALRAKQGISK